MIANVADLLAQARTSHPDGVALIAADGTPGPLGERLTWGELDDVVSRVAAGLERLGLVAGNRVVIATGNRIEFVAAYLATVRARLVAVPINPRSSRTEFLRMVRDCGARAVVADAATLDSARAAADELSSLRLVVVDSEPRDPETGFDALVSGEADVQPVGVDPESLAVLLYTSGASGVPRAAMLSHRALVANIEQVAAIDPPMVGPDDVVYGVLPLFHVYGLNAVLGQVVRQGGHDGAGRLLRPGALPGAHQAPRCQRGPDRAAGPGPLAPAG